MLSTSAQNGIWVKKRGYIMKFFHVYNDQYFEGLVKNNLINEDTGFKLMHVFRLPLHVRFNTIAVKGCKGIFQSNAKFANEIWMSLLFFVFILG